MIIPKKGETEEQLRVRHLETMKQLFGNKSQPSKDEKQPPANPESTE